MFHQFEGIWIEEGLTFAHLKGILSFIARSIYGEQPIRFKPKFYPYTGAFRGCGFAVRDLCRRGLQYLSWGRVDYDP